MTKAKWQESIPPKAIKAFRNNFILLTEILPEMEGTLYLSASLVPYLEHSLDEDVKSQLFSESIIDVGDIKEKLHRKRTRFDPLLKLFKNWAKAELKPIKIIHLEYEGKVLYKKRETERPKYRLELANAIKDITSLIENDFTVFELVSLATKGDLNSLLKLIKLDKIFLTANFTQDWIWIAQGIEDKRFFENLSKALLHDTFRDRLMEVKFGIACYLLWFLGFNKLPKHQLLDFIEGEKIAGYPDPNSFNRRLSRIGLKRSTR